MIDLIVNSYSYLILAVVIGLFIGALLTNNKE